MKKNDFPSAKNSLTFFISLFIMIVPTILVGQMESVVNSLADDEFAHPKDFLLTPADESTDGVCEDSLHRCTLRAALEEASYLGVPARVTFSVNGIIAVDDNNGSFGPTDDSWIQSIDQKVTIFGGGPNTPVLMGIENNTLITGIHFTNALYGIIVSGNKNQIGLDNELLANYISDNEYGILIAGDSNKITGNVIGLDILGHKEANKFGVLNFGNNNVIGGVFQGEGNVISGNDKGIVVNSFEPGSVAYIVGNQIGTDIAGTAAIGNKIGIEINGPNTIIGGTNPAAMNIISGNTESGILTGLLSNNIQIIGNHVGVDKTGNINIPNRDGIALGPGSTDCLVEKNLIKSNSQFGIYCSGIPQDSLESAGHLITENDILMNTIAGIGISDNSHHIVIGEHLGGAGVGNNIQFNGQGGVVFRNLIATPAYNTIRKNSFQKNGIKGIDIYSQCSICQDQTFPPDITSYTEQDAVTALVVGTHHDAGSRIDVYTGDINFSAHYEGKVWLGSTTVDANNDFVLAIDNCQCDIVATATDPDGNTSEFTDGEPLMTSLEDKPDLTISTKVYPNPFSDKVNIQFNLPISGYTKMSVYNLYGNVVETIFEDHLQAGEHQYIWSPKGLSSGLYYYKIISGQDLGISGKLFFTK